MKILFFVKGDSRFVYPRLAEAVSREQGCRVVAVTSSSVTAHRLRNTGIFDEIHDLASFLKNDVATLTDEDSAAALRDLDEAVGQEGYNCLVYGDRIIRSYPFDRLNKIMASTCRFWSQVLNLSNPDAIFAEIACAAEWTASAFARRLGIAYLAPYATPVSNRLFFIDEAQGIWEPMMERYQTMRQHGLSTAEVEEASTFLSSLRTNRTKPSFLLPALRSPLRISLPQLSKRLSRIPFRVQTYLEDGQFEIGSYDGTPPWQPIFTDMTRVVRHLLAESFVFDSKPLAGPTVYFPLHVQPEFTTEVRAPFAANQLAVIEHIAKSLPPGYRLVVKEHPGMKGARPLNFYQRIKHLYNVQLVSPSLDSHDLIKASSVVITITGSTAWEAALYERPVITLGRTCYDCPELINYCPDITLLPSLIRKLISTYKADRRVLLCLVTAMLQSAYHGTFGNGITNPKIMESANLKDLARAIMLEVDRKRRLLIASGR